MKSAKHRILRGVRWQGTTKQCGRSHMNWSKILKRIETGETRQTEFKRGLGDLSAVGKAICAFANNARRAGKERGWMVQGSGAFRDV